MRLSAVRQLVLVIASCLIGGLFLAGSAGAQSNQPVDCRNGHYCPPNNACLVGGMCGEMVDQVPGSVRTSGGKWCDPGFRENRYKPDSCVPGSYIECQNGAICPGGSRCGNDGTCIGGPPATGPVCGGRRCAAGRVCSSQGGCMNPEYFHDCGNGTICSKSAACEYPRGCVLVSKERTRQIPRNPMAR
jgi:hypothetical protein